MIWYQIQKLLGYDIYGTYPFCPVFLCHFLKNSDIEAFFKEINIWFGSNFRCIINLFFCRGRNQNKGEDHSPISISTKLYLAHTFEFPAKKGYDLGYDIYPKVFGDIDMI